MHELHACRESWAPGLQKYRAVSRERGDLGTVFLDLYQRPGKQQANAHYTLLCGKRVEGGRYRRPIVALACSFSSARAELSISEARPASPAVLADLRRTPRLHRCGSFWSKVWDRFSCARCV